MGAIYIIAEAGVNHNGSLGMAMDLVDAAAAVGADAVKFQTFRTGSLVTRRARKAAYQTARTGSDNNQYDMLKALELSEETHHRLLARCRDKGIAFLSTPFDPDSLDFLVLNLGLGCIKIGSGDLTNAPLIHRAAALGRDLILSTGMATLDEIRLALGAAALGYRNELPTGVAALREAGQTADLGDRVTLLHCTTEYPAPFEDVNLQAMDTLGQVFRVPVGFSDHTPGIVASVAAAARGATVVEKHLTLDRTLPGPDHQASLEPDDFADLVTDIRRVETLLGSPEKTLAPSETGNRDVARKSVRAARALPKDHTIQAADIVVKRPEDGLLANRYWDVVGRTTDRAYEPDEAFGQGVLAD